MSRQLPSKTNSCATFFHGMMSKPNAPRTKLNVRSMLLLKGCVIFQPANKQFKVFRDNDEFVVPLLVDVNHARFTPRTALCVVQTYHVVTRRRTIGEIHTDRWVAPLVSPKLAA